MRQLSHHVPMKTYVVPLKPWIKVWKTLFQSPFDDQTHLNDYMVSLILLMSTLIKTEHQIGSCSMVRKEARHYVNTLASTGQLEDKYIVQASRMLYEKASYLSRFLKEIGVIDPKKKEYYQFGGFVGMDIVLQIRNKEEIDSISEGLCQSG